LGFELANPTRFLIRLHHMMRALTQIAIEREFTETVVEEVVHGKRYRADLPCVKLGYVSGVQMGGGDLCR